MAIDFYNPTTPTDFRPSSYLLFLHPSSPPPMLKRRLLDCHRSSRRQLVLLPLFLLRRQTGLLPKLQIAHLRRIPETRPRTYARFNTGYYAPARITSYFQHRGSLL